jgi:hypothetical protein
MRRATVLLLIAGAACGGENSPRAGFEVRFLISRGGKTFECRDVAEVQSVEVTILNANGLTPLPGWPRSADCASGSLTDQTLPAGSYVVEVAALGTLAGTPDTVLFRARREITLPSEPIEISLAPEVAFLAVEWSFERMGNLDPCDDEIDRVHLYVSTGAAGPGSYRNESLGCRDTPFSIPTPFLAQPYTVRLEAYSRQTGRLLYVVRDSQRVLQRGDNPTYQAVFVPSGGRLTFDWQFGVSGAISQDCTDPRVGVGAMNVHIENTLGDEPVDAAVDCRVPRPFTFRDARFGDGEQLRFELRGEGTRRFYASRLFTMPAMDLDLGLLTLNPVGNATVAFTVTPTCAAAVDGFEVTLSEVATGNLSRDVDLDAMERSAALRDVVYGEYQVAIVGRRAGATQCSAQGRREIRDRENAWAPFDL